MHVNEGRPVIFYLVLRIPSGVDLRKIRSAFLEKCLGLDEPVISDRTGVAFSCRFRLSSVLTKMFISATHEGIVSVLLVDNLYPLRDVHERFSEFVKFVIERIRNIAKRVEILKTEYIDLGPNLASWSKITYP